MTEESAITEPSTLSLSDLHERLKARGVSIAAGKLSEFVNSGDVAQQLAVGTTGNRKEFLPETVDILAEFLPKFRGLKGVSWEQAPNYLRSFLKKENSALVAVSQEDSHFQESVNPLAIAAEQGREQGLAQADEVFTAQEAAAFLKVSVSLLREYVKPSFRIGKSGRGDRWRRSDLLRFTSS